MNSNPFQDPRANDLLSRVSEDVTLLRKDIGNLLSHTRNHTLPGGARELADHARHRIAAGRVYSQEQLRALRKQVREPACAWIGGAVVVGLVAAGVYLLTRKSQCEQGWDEDEYLEEEES